MSELLSKELHGGTTVSGSRAQVSESQGVVEQSVSYGLIREVSASVFTINCKQYHSYDTRAA